MHLIEAERFLTERAVFSADRKYRYSLRRRIEGTSGMWADHKIIDHPLDAVLFVLLNPSTADENKNDPTIRRCIGYARRWGYSRLYIGNVSPVRATDPTEMIKKGPEPDWVTRQNHEALKVMARRCSRVILGWGVHGVAEGRDIAALAALKEVGVDLECLKETKDGHPGHPLYLEKTLEPKMYWMGGRTIY